MTFKLISLSLFIYVCMYVCIYIYTHICIWHIIDQSWTLKLVKIMKHNSKPYIICHYLLLWLAAYPDCSVFFLLTVSQVNWSLGVHSGSGSTMMVGDGNVTLNGRLSHCWSGFNYPIQITDLDCCKLLIVNINDW